MAKLRIATRESALALWQANHVKALLEAAHDGLSCEIVGMTTEGDRNKSSPLSQMGGKGVFVKELEVALLSGDADIAVHSMKDVPGELPSGLSLSAMVARANPLDAFVCNERASLSDLPSGAIVGSSSLRRVLQLKEARPDVTFKELRGNVDTRLRKLDDGDYDAIILACAGLDRLGLSERIREPISSDVCLPAAGQGAIGIESREEDEPTRSLLNAISDTPTETCVSAERQVTRMLEATCNLPVAVYAELADSNIGIRAYLANEAGTQTIRNQIEGDSASALILAKQLGEQLLEQGAHKLMGG